MKNQRKVLGEKRREMILQLLLEKGEPITGNELATMANVSRQIIVGDITLLKAKGEPILATSQGYMYLSQGGANLPMVERTIASSHSPEQTEEELNILVDYGVTVKDVRIEHPVYGDLTASVMVSNRKEVSQFMKKIKKTNASYLSELTGGIHLHTISAATKEKLDEAEAALKQANFLVE
ncbi:transcriptional regulator of NAD metabolism [Cytobacillus eiseniae]|uniref:Transcriptional regulator of NAD metabolism n=1 Tax=Cytobacillus eiseniae TaxID=762947 RepID=A0ABS4RCD5_9BACI|nr:transcription repressor NadR [Cytobacillus eiseniae]MBP2240565.1 transcriptional regulator of NAD metabolism [Cytobacillus eiseniae]